MSHHGPIDVEIAHGYRLSDVQRLARQATAATRAMATDATYRFSTAWSAIAEAIWTAETPPADLALFGIGRSAVWALADSDRSTYGYRDQLPSNGIGSAPRFAAYWGGRINQDPMDAVVERIAVGQVLAAMTPTQRVTLAAYAAAGNDRVQAAQALGLTKQALDVRIWNARAAAARRWWQGETPRSAPLRRLDRRQDQGDLQPCGTHAAARRHKLRGETACDLCTEARRRYDRARRERRKVARAAT